MHRYFALFLLLVSACLAYRSSGDAADSNRPHGKWWRGNTHTHTLWSDGDAAPEVPAAWYSENGYHFLVLSDHNVLSSGERWFPVSEDGRLTPERVDALRARFGAESVVVRERDGAREMRLKTLAELRERFEVDQQFLFLQGEEITASFRDGERGLPVHVNGINLAETIAPPTGSSAADVLNKAVDAVAEQGRRLGRPTLAHINHPNFGWGLTWRDVAAVRSDRFFEVYNGHRGVRNEGDDEHPSMELMWDYALALRMTELDLGLLYGVATDDAHNHWGPDAVSIPGRGWIVVRAAELSAEALIEAMGRGDFYASSGVALSDVYVEDGRYVVDIEAEPGVAYTTHFIGTRKSASGGPLAVGAAGAAGEVGVELASSAADPAEYAFRGDELYVRAVVVSTRLHPHPYREGDYETAWAQPVQPR